MKHRFETFTVLITKISRNVKRLKNKEMAEYDLKGPHISCLYYLYTAKGLTATQLCERCEEDKATISRAIEYLEGRGFLTCQSKSIKRYNSLLTLTEKGEEAGKKIAEKIDRILEDVGEGLSEEDRLSFYKSLAIISENLEKIERKSKNGKSNI
ncbi:MAG: MarR family transcriptional regulator [Clostridia bacterium]|nr:MarR family transcriptional regulator [Clostridia bacterium]